MSEGRSRFAGPSIVGWSAAVLVAMSVALLAVYGTGEEGVRVWIRATARTSLALFLPAFVASSLRRLWRTDLTAWLLRNRRYVGLSFAVSHALHLAAIVSLARGWPEAFWANTKAATIYGGGAGFVFVGLMAATSNDASMRLLGARAWKALHATGAWVLFVIFFQSYFLRGFVSPGYLPASLAVIAALGVRIVGRKRRATDVAGDQRSKRRLASA